MFRPTYDFEELDESLSRPPLAALRALHVAGVVFSPRGWQEVPVETRRTLTNIGGQDGFDEGWIRTGAMGVFPPRYARMTSPIPDPAASEIPALVEHALGDELRLPLAFWQAIRPLDRRVLMMLASNRRLFQRAVEEISLLHRYPLVQLTTDDVAVTLGHAEVHVDRFVGQKLVHPDVLEGRALLLARTAGIRAARAAALTLGLHGDTATGVVEIGSQIRRRGDGMAVTWQAHVSTIEGAFFPAASLLGATTAATALVSIVASAIDGSASVEAARIVDEPWDSMQTLDAPTIALGRH